MVQQVSKIAIIRNFSPPLLFSAVNVITVGRQLGLLLYYMIIMGKVKAQDIHLIGHSLGAHASHYASIWLEELAKTYPDPSDPQINITVSDWKIGRITGLDPAAQGFEGFPGTYLVKEDAAFVDVIHTSSVTFSGNWMDTILGHYGMSLLIGSIDFFPNGGWTTQPDCQGLEYIDRTCSHRMVTDYFRDSLVNGTQAHDPDTKRYPSVPCESWSEFEKCLKTFGVDSQLFEDAQNISSFLTQDQSNLTSSMGIQSVNFYGRGRHYLHAFLDPAKPHKRWSEVWTFQCPSSVRRTLTDVSTITWRPIFNISKFLWSESSSWQEYSFSS